MPCLKDLLDYSLLSGRKDRIICDPQSTNEINLYVSEWIRELAPMEDKYKFIVIGESLWEAVCDFFIDKRRTGFMYNGLFGRVDGVRLYSAEFFRPADMHKSGLSIDEFPKRNELIPSLILNSKNFTRL